MRRELINLFGEAGAVTAAAERGTNRAGCLCDVLLIHPPTLLGRPPRRSSQFGIYDHDINLPRGWNGVAYCAVCILRHPRARRANCAAAITHTAPGYIIIAAVSRVTIAIVRERVSQPLYAYVRSLARSLTSPHCDVPWQQRPVQVNLRLVSR